jgi:protein-L-isoaspartate(D-aspartate) O-methyltransferase
MNFEKEHLLLTIRGQLEQTAQSNEEEHRIDRIIEAIRFVDRKYFVTDKSVAYLNEALPIGQQQTISQPFTVARILQVTGIEPGNHILEVGSGSGWNACIMAYLAYPGETISNERIPELSISAAATTEKFKRLLKLKGESKYHRLDRLRFIMENVFAMDDGASHYDRIIVTAGITPGQESKLQKLSLRFLTVGGRLVCPYVSGPLIIIENLTNGLNIHYTKDLFVFVPLIESNN